LRAVDESGTDISNLIEQYSGFSRDFHGNRVTPRVLERTSITIINREIETRFEIDEPLRIQPIV
jgi:hypothetical protein